MNTDSGWHQWEDDNLLIAVRIQPGSCRDEVVGIVNNTLKIRITTTPVKGKANNQLIKYLAKIFGVAKSRVKLIAGDNCRNKRLRVESPTTLPAKWESP